MTNSALKKTTHKKQQVVVTITHTLTFLIVVRVLQHMKTMKTKQSIQAYNRPLFFSRDITIHRYVSIYRTND